jgi:hypothetical protein
MAKVIEGEKVVNGGIRKEDVVTFPEN